MLQGGGSFGAGEQVLYCCLAGSTTLLDVLHDMLRTFLSEYRGPELAPGPAPMQSRVCRSKPRALPAAPSPARPPKQVMFRSHALHAWPCLASYLLTASWAAPTAATLRDTTNTGYTPTTPGAAGTRARADVIGNPTVVQTPPSQPSLEEGSSLSGAELSAWRRVT